MRTVAIIAAWMLLPAACGGGSEGRSADSTDTGAASSLVSLPGGVTDPSGAAVLPDSGTSVLLYYWLPMRDHAPMEEDLALLATAGSPELLVLPVQPEPGLRNFAQTLVNELGISLPVCLADSDVIREIGTGILPAALLLRPDGSILRETGFGCPARILGTLQTAD